MLSTVSLCSSRSRGIGRKLASLFFVCFTRFLFLPTVSAATLQQGFQESIVFSGLSTPTAVRFASEGRIFVAEKGGRIKVFDSL